MAGVLDGIRVLDFGRYIAGPFCAALLGDLGAEVIRIERRGRRRGPLHHPGRRRRRWRRRDVPGDEPQQARHDARPGRAEGPRDRQEAGRDRRCRRRQPAAARCCARWRSTSTACAQVKPDIILTTVTGFGAGGPLSQQARLRRHRPGDERRGVPVRHARAADRAQGAVGRFRHRVLCRPSARWRR